MVVLALFGIHTVAIFWQQNAADTLASMSSSAHTVLLPSCLPHMNTLTKNPQPTQMTQELWALIASFGAMFKSPIQRAVLGKQTQERSSHLPTWRMKVGGARTRHVKHMLAGGSPPPLPKSIGVRSDFA